VLCTAFLYLKFGFVIFWCKSIGKKAACKMSVKSVLINNMLKAGFGKWYIETLLFGFIDTLPFFRKFYPQCRNHKLETLMQRFGLKGKQTHGALNDSVDLRDVIKIVLEEGNISFEELIRSGFKKTEDIQLTAKSKI
jgi:DNA polymerase III alpha subunit (gram-positive type)